MNASNSTTVTILSLKPGDVLLFSTSSHVTMRRKQEFLDDFQKIFKEQKIAFLTDATWDVTAVTEADINKHNKGEDHE